MNCPSDPCLLLMNDSVCVWGRWYFESQCSLNVCWQKRDPRQRLCGERAEGNLSVVLSERASPLGEQQQPLALQLTFCTNTVRS